MSGLAFVEIQAGDLEPKKPADAQAESKSDSKPESK
jgi:hypothetical protein